MVIPGGESEEHAQVSENSLEIDEAAGLQMISIRLDKTLIEDLKFMGSRRDIGYKPLIRKILDHFVYKKPEKFLQALSKLAREEEEIKYLKVLHAKSPYPVRGSEQTTRRFIIEMKLFDYRIILNDNGKWESLSW